VVPQTTDEDGNPKPLTKEQKQESKKNILSRKHCGSKLFRRRLFRRFWGLKKTGCFGLRRFGVAYDGFGNPYPSGGWTVPWGWKPFGFWSQYYRLACFSSPFASSWTK
jgi:hypothetical protein